MSEYIISSEQFERSIEAIAHDSSIPITEVYVSNVKLPEIVRCRDCKHYKAWVLARPQNGGDCRLNKNEVDVMPDGFCAWGERRES